MKIGILGNIAKIKTAETMEEIISFLQSLGYEQQGLRHIRILMA